MYQIVWMPYIHQFLLYINDEIYIAMKYKWKNKIPYVESFYNEEQRSIYEETG